MKRNTISAADENLQRFSLCGVCVGTCFERVVHGDGSVQSNHFALKINNFMSRQRKGLLSSCSRLHVAFVDSLSTVSLS